MLRLMLSTFILVISSNISFANHERPPSTYETMCLSIDELKLFISRAELKYEILYDTMLVTKSKTGDVLWIKNKNGMYCRSGKKA